VEQVLGGDCPSTRDTSIQIFDKFLLFSYAEDNTILRDTDFLSNAAAASVILAAKLQDTKSKLRMVRDSSRFSVVSFCTETIIH
jgi:hypothetical protein